METMNDPKYVVPISMETFTLKGDHLQLKEETFSSKYFEEPAGAPAVCDGHLTALAMGTRGCGWLHFALYVDASFYASWVTAAVAAGEARLAVREKLEDAGVDGDGSGAKGRHPEPISLPSPPPRR